jgi:hypothetical protein
MFRTTNIDEIDQIVCMPMHLKRRIKKECQTIKNAYDNIIIEYLEQDKILVSFKKSKKDYTFEITPNYPFTAPKVYVNGQPHNEFFRLPSARFTNILQYVSGIDCFCCNSLLCKNNWAPAVTLEKVINQFEEYKTIKLYIQQKILADQIKRKFLVKDIDLDSWLFNI